MTNPITRVVHHIGLTVSKLEESAAFFVNVLGWKEVRRDNEYPAIYVSDGSVLVTLWKNKENPPVAFNRFKNVGLHHVAFAVESEARLNEVHDILKRNNVEIQFPPQLLRDGPAKHMMCFEPSGIRVEFTWPGK